MMTTGRPLAQNNKQKHFSYDDCDVASFLFDKSESLTCTSQGHNCSDRRPAPYECLVSGERSAVAS